MAQVPSLEELQARYDDGDPAHPAGDAAGGGSAAVVGGWAGGGPDSEHSPVQQPQPHVSRATAAAAEAAMLASPGESDEEDEHDDDSDLELQDYLDLHDDERHGGVAAFGGLGQGGRRPNQQLRRGATQPATKALQPTSNSTQKLDARVNLGRVQSRNPDSVMDSLDDNNFRMSNKVATAYRVGATKQLDTGGRNVDKSDRATVEQALDPRTRMVLFKMLNRGVFAEINGVVSTGKEANVYHATAPSGDHLAVKVYKTSILVFKDRERYVKGDFRFRKGYSKSNPRKMVKVWAEKEMRNLVRLAAAGIRCPRAHLLQMHVLVMSFLGTGPVAAPRLKDAHLPLARLRGAYSEMLLILRTLYQTCHLVHGDLSEYNILVHEGELYIIDVSQSVELDHPLALDFLREDIAHINAFFRRAGVATLTMRELFDFVVDPSINDDNIEAALEQLRTLAGSRPLQRTAEEEVQDSLFSQAYIPKHLDDVDDHEADFQRLAAGGGAAEGIYYQGITGMRPDMSGARDAPMLLAQPADTSTAPELQSGSGKGDAFRDASGDEASSDSESDDSSDGSGDEEWEERVDKGMSKEERKAHKALVKAANRERRKTKTPKKGKQKAKKAHKK